MESNENLSPLVDPIVLSTSFSQKSPEQGGYSRVGNPTRSNLEKKLARLEKAKYSLVFPSGSAVMANILLSLKSGDQIICHEEVYEGMLRLLDSVFGPLGIKASLVNLLDLDQTKKAINKKTRLIWMENITNPTVKKIDVKKVAEVIKNREIKLVVDNTFATPFFANPLVEGADIVVHSLTKFIGGHHDVSAGALMLNDRKIFERLRFLQRTVGSIPSPFDCFLMSRSLETFEVRMLRHQQNALKIIKSLKSNSAIKKISHPGVSGMIAFWLKGGTDKIQNFLSKLKTVKIAQSFGGSQTTILHPRSMMTFSLPEKKLARLGITNNLLRLSVGLENPEKIIKDIRQALT